MARFYGDIQGSRGEATRMGGKESGMRGHIRGWTVGVRVYCYADKDDRDICEIYETGGSHATKPEKLIAKVGERIPIKRKSD